MPQRARHAAPRRTGRTPFLPPVPVVPLSACAAAPKCKEGLCYCRPGRWGLLISLHPAPAVRAAMLWLALRCTDQ